MINLCKKLYSDIKTKNSGDEVDIWVSLHKQKNDTDPLEFVGWIAPPFLRSSTWNNSGCRTPGKLPYFARQASNSTSGKLLFSIWTAPR